MKMKFFACAILINGSIFGAAQKVARENTISLSIKVYTANDQHQISVTVPKDGTVATLKSAISDQSEKSLGKVVAASRLSLKHTPAGKIHRKDSLKDDEPISALSPHSLECFTK